MYSICVLQPISLGIEIRGQIGFEDVMRMYYSSSEAEFCFSKSTSRVFFFFSFLENYKLLLLPLLLFGKLLLPVKSDDFVIK